MAKTFTFNIKPQTILSFDWSTFLITVSLVALGLISIYSATYDSQMSSFFYKQLFAAGIGFIGLFILLFLPEGWLKGNSYLVYALCMALLGFVLFFGTEARGTKGWINLGSYSIQPSELAKFGVLIFLANHLSMKGRDIRQLRDLFFCIAIVAAPMFLIMKQPDFGTSTVLLAMLVGIMYWTGFHTFALYFILSLPFIIIMSLKGQVYFIFSVALFSSIAFLFRQKLSITIVVIAVFVLIGFASPKIYNSLAEHQKDRIETFLNPGKNPRGKGYNVIQSKLAIGSGGISGKGYLQGTQTQLRYIPMQWSDFIFSVPAEEFGFLGGSLVILLEIGLIYRAVKVSFEATTKFHTIASFGAASIFLYHTSINIGMAIGIMPVMGIPLPFMSYGGTSLVVNLSLIGIIMNAYKNSKKIRTV